MPVDQSIHGRIRTVRVDDRKQFFRPVRHVTFLEVTFRFADAHAIADSILGAYHHRRARTTAATPFPDWRRSPPKEPCRCCDDSCRCTNARNPVARRRSGSSVSSWNNATYASSGSCWSAQRRSPSSPRCASRSDARRTLSATVAAVGSKIPNPYRLHVVGLLLLTSFSNRLKAATSDAADLLFSGMHHARFENTSITVSRNVVPSLAVFRRDMSTRSACHCWLGPPTTTQRRLKWRLTGLWRVYASCVDSHLSTSRSAGTTLRKAATPP